MVREFLQDRRVSTFFRRSVGSYLFILGFQGRVPVRGGRIFVLMIHVVRRFHGSIFASIGVVSRSGENFFFV